MFINPDTALDKRFDLAMDPELDADMYESGRFLRAELPSGLLG